MYHLDIRWRAFPLHTDVPPEGMPIKQLLADLPVDFKVVVNKHAAMAAELGLPFADQDRIYNSRPAHELGAWAGTMGKVEAWHKAVFHAYYAQGRNISRPHVLGDVAASIGLSRETAVATLDAGAYAAVVDRDWELARQHEIIAAPTYLLPASRLVGAHPYEKLQQFIESNGAVKRRKEEERH